jgi:hypothetical protein
MPPSVAGTSEMKTLFPVVSCVLGDNRVPSRQRLSVSDATRSQVKARPRYYAILCYMPPVNTIQSQICEQRPVEDTDQAIIILKQMPV